jgi:heat shock protein HtpX
MGVQLIGPETRDAEAQWLYSTVARLTQAANLPMPEVGIYQSPELNAFATGPSKSRSLVAVSSGLLSRMDRQEVEGVLAHEVTHIANGDMVTMTLIQGVVNAFVLYLAHVVAAIARNALGRDEQGRPNMMGYVASQVAFIAAQIAFGILGSMITAWFSRHREFRADAGGARVAGREKMIGALEALQRTYGIVDGSSSQAAVQTLKISGHPKGLMRLLSTHPPLETRISRLKMLA